MASEAKGHKLIPVRPIYTFPSLGYIGQAGVRPDKLQDNLRVAGLQGFRQRVRAGRFVVAPDTPSSLNTVLHPAFFKAASCKAGFWSSVLTRA
jgi:hypothetical protein